MKLDKEYIFRIAPYVATGICYAYLLRWLLVDAVQAGGPRLSFWVVLLAIFAVFSGVVSGLGLVVHGRREKGWKGVTTVVTGGVIWASLAVAVVGWVFWAIL